MVFKELICNSFYFGETVVVSKKWFVTVSTLETVAVLKELVCNSSYFGRLWQS